MSSSPRPYAALASDPCAAQCRFSHPDIMPAPPPLPTPAPALFAAERQMTFFDVPGADEYEVEEEVGHGTFSEVSTITWLDPMPPQVASFNAAPTATCAGAQGPPPHQRGRGGPEAHVPSGGRCAAAARAA